MCTQLLTWTWLLTSKPPSLLSRHQFSKVPKYSVNDHFCRSKSCPSQQKLGRPVTSQGNLLYSCIINVKVKEQVLLLLAFVMYFHASWKYFGFMEVKSVSLRNMKDQMDIVALHPSSKPSGSINIPALFCPILTNFV